MASVDLKQASLILDRALLDAKMISDDIGQLIESVLRGSHKTYRYILITGLLAKATNEGVDALSLQKGDGEKGKYDARSLCHRVIVPFETIKLPGCLGSSNEPFLNKPARFERISLSNAVRKGSDREILKQVIDILSQIRTSSEAYCYLCSALTVLKELSASYIARFSIGDTLIDISDFSQLVLDYVYQLTDHPSEGESCPLIVAQLEQMYLGKEYKVEPHKVNQSGNSSKEIGDIDVRNKEGKLLYSIEIKDKDFTEYDVLHAIKKFKQAELDTSFFIYGKHVIFNEKEVNATLHRIGREGHFCCLISILHYAKLRIADSKQITIREFVSGLLSFARAINVKDDTIALVKDIASKIFDSPT